MATLASQPHPPLPIDEIPPWPVVRFTVEEYHRLIELGILTEDDNLELLDGWLVRKMPKNPPHDGTIDLLSYLLNQLLPAGWFLRIQNSLRLTGSEPEPDLAIVSGKPGDYRNRHPEGSDVAMVVEVADTSVNRDREKGRLYAQAGIPSYWIVNLVDGVLEVYSDPQEAAGTWDYSQQLRLRPADRAPLTIAGQVCGMVAVADMIKV